MTLGFSVDSLLPKARGGGQLRMGLVKVAEREWLQPQPDLAARAAGFADWPQGVQLTPEVAAPGRGTCGDAWCGGRAAGSRLGRS